MKSLTLLACATLLLPLASAAAQTAAPSAQQPAAPAGVSAADRKFIEQAASYNGAAIQVSQLALQKSSEDSVRQFAQRIIDHHTKADTQLKQIAALKGVPLPAANPKADAEARQLQALNGAAFDQQYARIAFKDHTELVKLCHQEDQPTTHDRQVSGYAGDSAPLFEEDSDKAEQLVAALAKGHAKGAKVTKAASQSGQ